MGVARGLVTVWLHVPPEREEEFNAWYDLEHIDQIVNIPGFACARRYVTNQQVPKYLAWYETIDERVEPGPSFQYAVANPTPWSRRMRGFYGDNRQRNNYRLAVDCGTEPQPDTPWLYLVQTDCADAARKIEFYEWYDREHLPALARVPGVQRARRYSAASGAPESLAAYELTTREVFESPAWLAARAAARTDAMRPLFAHARRAMYRLILPSVRPSAARG